MEWAAVFWVGVVGVGLFGLLWYAGRSEDARRFRAVLDARPEADGQDLLALWGESDPAGPRIRLVRAIAGDLGVAVGVLRPDDRLSSFNTPGVGDDPAVEAIHDRVRAVPGQPDWGELERFGEIVEYCCRSRQNA